MFRVSQQTHQFLYKTILHLCTHIVESLLSIIMHVQININYLFNEEVTINFECLSTVRHVLHSHVVQQDEAFLLLQLLVVLFSLHLENSVCVLDSQALPLAFLIRGTQVPQPGLPAPLAQQAYRLTTKLRKHITNQGTVPAYQREHHKS